MALREEPTRWDAGSEHPQQEPLARGQTPFDDQAVFNQFLEQQCVKLRQRLDHCIGRHEQMEIGRLLEILTSMPPRVAYENRAILELAFDIHTAEQPNLVLAAQLRGVLLVATARSTRLGRIIVGRVPIQTVALGLLTTLLLLAAAIFVLDLVQAHLRMAAGTGSHFHPVAELVQRMPITQIIALVVAAFVGAVVSVLSRMRKILDVARALPLLVYITVATKPLVSIAFATFVYAVLGSGMLAVPGMSLDSPHVGYLVWVLGFLSGFSERFVQDFIGQADRIVAPGAIETSGQGRNSTG